jgi:hypothetical protein
LEDLSLDVRIILIWIFKKRNGKLGTDQVLDKEKWRACVNLVMDLRVP